MTDFRDPPDNEEVYKEWRDEDESVGMKYLQERYPEIGPIEWHALGQPEVSHDPYSPETARLGLPAESPPAPEFIIEELLPKEAGGIVGAGGTMKTTFALWLGLNIAAGLPVFKRRILRPGPVLFITAEDNRDTMGYRVWNMQQEMLWGLDGREQVEASWRENIYVVDVSGNLLARLVVSQFGNLAEAPDVERIIAAYQHVGLSAIFIDPAIYFGAGEQSLNDGMAALMAVGKKLSARLNCAVTFIHHVSQAVSREEIIDAHSGRGGTAFGDNARFMFVMVPHKEERSARFPVPAAMQNCTNPSRLHHVKNSFGPLVLQPMWFGREPGRSWAMCSAISDPPLNAEECAKRKRQQQEQDLQVFLDWFRQEFPDGASSATIEARRETLPLPGGNPSQQRIRSLVALAQHNGSLKRAGKGPTSRLVLGQ